MNYFHYEVIEKKVKIVMHSNSVSADPYQKILFESTGKMQPETDKKISVNPIFHPFVLSFSMVRDATNSVNIHYNRHHKNIIS